ncbi:hypothetical protein ACLOJK_026098 [Asimina triloba]
MDCIRPIVRRCPVHTLADDRSVSVTVTVTVTVTSCRHFLPGGCFSVSISTPGSPVLLPRTAHLCCPVSVVSSVADRRTDLQSISIQFSGSPLFPSSSSSDLLCSPFRWQLLVSDHPVEASANSLANSAASNTRLLIQRLDHFLQSLEELGLRAEHLQALKIRDELLRMSSFIRAADAMEERSNATLRKWKQLERKKRVRAWRAWLEQVREVAFSLEDAINDFELYLFHDPYLEERHTSVALLLKGIWILRRKVHLLLLLPARIRNIDQRVLNISKQYPEDDITVVKAGISPSVRISCCIGETSDHPFVGIEEARDSLLQWVLEGNPKRQLVTTTLTGLEGTGKTTLARQVYNTQAVKKHYDFRAWITVSRRYRLHNILLRMLEQLHPALCEAAVEWTLEEAVDQVADFFRGKRYLIVLDDIWMIEILWKIMEALPNSDCGSQVLITTTDSDIVRGRHYKVSPLSSQDAWHLFRKKAFPPDSVCPIELEATAKRIVRLLGGLPLSIVIAGGLLRFKKQNEWIPILQRLSHEYTWPNTEYKILTMVIRLSFHNLPYYLKSCILYLCFFPEDASIRGMRLIRLWTAEGFIQAGENKTAEELAEDYLSALITLGLVQVSEFHEDGRPRSCRVHSLIRDEIMEVAKEENMLAVAKSACFPIKVSIEWAGIHSRVRRLSIQDNFEQDANLTCFRYLQSLCISGVVSLPESSIQMAVTSFRLLKVLDLEGIPLKKFPAGVESLLLLKYLGLRHSQITELPRSVGSLVDLETLDLKGSQISSLPKEILKLKCLRHLLVGYHATHGVSVPEGIGMLNSLQSLGCIDAPEESSVVGELGNLIHMRSLRITKSNKGDASSLCSSIDKMVRLCSLKVMLNNEDQTLDLQAMSSPPAGLQRLHLRGHLEKLPRWVEVLQNLVKLSLSGSRLRHDPFEILKSLPNLAVLIFIRAFEGEELHCEAGGFPSLKILKLVELHRLGIMNAEKGAFPYLTELHIWHCPNLKKIPPFLQTSVNIKPEENKLQPQGNREEEEDEVPPIFPIHPTVGIIARITTIIATLGGILSSVCHGRSVK